MSYMENIIKNHQLSGQVIFSQISQQNYFTIFARLLNSNCGKLYIMWETIKCNGEAPSGQGSNWP